MAVLAIVLRFSLWFMIAEPIRAVDLWCGKTYKPQDALIDPGGAFVPSTRSKVPLLQLTVRPRMNLYLDEDTSGSFIVDAAISYTVGQPLRDLESQLLSNATSSSLSPNLQLPAGNSEQLSVAIIRSDTGAQLLSDKIIALNTTGNELLFTLSAFDPSRKPYSISLTARRPNGRVFTASTTLNKKPDPQKSPTISRIDSLHGGILARTASKEWTTIFPYSLYLGGPWLRENPGNMRKFADAGYNVLHIIPAGGLGYELEELDAWMDEADKVGLWIMLDMRWSYKVPNNIQILVERVQRHKNLLLWYTADEPDGFTDPRGATKNAYDLINELDGYHPVSLCLNCQNFYFKEYTSGADIVLTDPYPIGNRLDYSDLYKTPCNTTYGDCGCDNCYTSQPSPLLNVPQRFDDYRTYQTQLSLPPKPLWAVPQAFGDQQFWKREPTSQELIAMTLLSINHGAKGVVMWTWPTSSALTDVTSRFSKLATQNAAPFWLGTNAQLVDARVDGKVVVGLEAAVWVVGTATLVSVVNVAGRIPGAVVITLPSGVQARAIRHTAWGSGGWKVSDGNKLTRNVMEMMESEILILESAGGVGVQSA